MDSKITIYQPSTGRILRNVECPPDIILLQVQPGEAYIDGTYDGDDYYMVGTTPTIRPSFTPLTTRSITANGTDSAYMGDVPSGSFVSIITPPSADNIIDDNVTLNISLSSIVEGNHDFLIDNWPYKEYSATIVVLPIGSSGLDDQWFAQTAPDIMHAIKDNLSIGTYNSLATSISSTSNATFLSTNKINQVGISLNSIVNFNQLLSSVSFNVNGTLNSVSNTNQQLNTFTFNQISPDVGTGNFIQQSTEV
jgi:hypothetical protein